MIKKLFFTLMVTLPVLLLALIVVPKTYAASTSIRLEDPQSPINQSTFNINFVTQDILGRGITVKCFKQGPSDGGFSQFGSDILVSSGGNTGDCPVDGSIVNNGGTYQFKATAQAGGDPAVIGNTVSVNYVTGNPGTPTNYSKEQPSSCVWRIKFRTADDGGKTVKVEVYRSDQTSFNADSGSRVATVSIGSNTDGSADVTSPDCSKTYYFAVRAFDSADNGSGVVGDSVTQVTTTNPTTTTTASTAGGGGAIAVSPGSGSVLGAKTQEGVAGEVKGESTKEAQTPSPSAQSQAETKEPGKLITTKNIIIALVILVIAALGFSLLKRRQKTV